MLTVQGVWSPLWQKKALQNYLIPAVLAYSCVVSWLTIIPGLAALQQTERTEKGKKIPNRKLWSGSYCPPVSVFVIYLAVWFVGKF